MPEFMPIQLVPPILVLVVKADEDGDDPVHSDRVRALRVAAKVRRCLDSYHAPRRVIHSGAARGATVVASIFRCCVIDVQRPTFTTPSDLSPKDEDLLSSDRFAVFGRQAFRHLSIQTGCDALIAVLNREVSNAVVLMSFKVRGLEPPIRCALQGGEACVILPDGTYLECRDDPPAAS